MAKRLGKRSSYVTETESSSDEDADYISTRNSKRLRTNKNDRYSVVKVGQEFEEDDYTISYQGRKTRKCTTKNAVMARENRQRKKMYIQNLEKQVSKLRKNESDMRSIVSKQSLVIAELRQERKYLKSILANSSDIGNLVKNIRNSTGMSVVSSLDKSLTVNNDCVSKHKTYISRKTAHPWENHCAENHSFDDPLLNGPINSDLSEDYDIANAFSDLNLPLDIDIPFPNLHLEFDLNQDAALCLEGMAQTSPVDSPPSTFQQDTWKEHNYTNNASSANDEKEDVGVCLHVSTHGVSLEFCPTCSTKALHAWKND